MVEFSPTALNFGYDFVPLVHFLGHPVYIFQIKSSPMLDSDVTHHDGIGPDQPLYLSSTDSLQQFPLCQQKSDDLIKTTCQ